MVSLEDLPVFSSKKVIDDGGSQSFPSTPTCHIPVVNFLLDELIDSRLQIEGSRCTCLSNAGFSIVICGDTGVQRFGIWSSSFSKRPGLGFGLRSLALCT